MRTCRARSRLRWVAKRSEPRSLLSIRYLTCLHAYSTFRAVHRHGWYGRTTRSGSRSAARSLSPVKEKSNPVTHAPPLGTAAHVSIAVLESSSPAQPIGNRNLPGSGTQRTDGPLALSCRVPGAGCQARIGLFSHRRGTALCPALPFGLVFERMLCEGSEVQSIGSLCRCSGPCRVERPFAHARASTCAPWGRGVCVMVMICWDE